MKQTLWAAAVVTALVLAACSTEPDVDLNHAGLDTSLKCEAGQTGWNFSEFPVSASTSEAVSKNPEAAAPNGEPPSTFQIVEAKCSNDFTWTATASDECDGRTRCVITTPCASADTYSIRYRCSGSPDKIFTSPPLEMANKPQGRRQVEIPCPQPIPPKTTTPPRVACVPEQCHGATRRNADLGCVADFNRPTVELARTAGNGSSLMQMGVSFDSGSLKIEHSPRRLSAGTVDQVLGVDFLKDQKENWVLFPKSVVVFNGVKLRYNAPLNAGEAGLKGRVAFWLADEYQRKNSKDTIKVWRCLMHSVETSKYTNSRVVVGDYKEMTLDKERFELPNDCTNENNTFLYRELTAKKLGLSSEAQFREMYSFVQTRINASFDLEGQNIVIPVGSTRESACSTNPIDFFYVRAGGAHDMVGYHEQRAIPVEYPWGDKPSGYVTFRQPNRTEVGIHAARPKQAELRLKAFGPARGNIRVDVDWYLAHDRDGYWGRYGMPAYDTEYRVMTYLVPKDETTGKQLPQPRDGYTLLGSTKVVKTGAMGQTAAARYVVTEELRAELLRSGSPIDIGVNGRRTYELLTCLIIYDRAGKFARPNGLGPPDEDGVYRLELQPGGDTAPAGYQKPPAACRWASAPLQIRLDKAVTPLEPLAAGDWAGESNPAASGDDRLEQKLDNDGERNCDSNAAGGARCRSTASNSLRGTGMFGGTWAGIEGEGQNSQGESFDAQGKGELLSFNVLDDEEDALWQGPKGAVKIELAPPWEDIRQALSATYHAPKWTTGRYAGMMGLGVGWGYKQPLYYGPVQIGVSLVTVSMGLSLTLSLEWRMDNEYPCLNQGGACAKVMQARSLRDALNSCYATGGRLGEYSSAAEAQKVLSAVLNSDAKDVWLGAQVANEYSAVGCMKTWNSTLCSTGHITSARWLTNDEDFASATSFGAASFIPAFVQFPSSAAQLTMSVTAGRPHEEGVALKRDGKLEIRPTHQVMPSICVYDDATEDQSHTFTAAVGIGLAVGVGVGFCTPSDEAGICLVGSVNLVSVGLKPSFNYTYHRLKNAAGQTAERSNVNFSFDWELRILEGAIDVKLVVGPFEMSYNLFTFNGLVIPPSVAGGKFFDINFPSIEAFQ